MKGRSSFALDLRCPDDGHLLRAYTDLAIPFAICRHCDGAFFTREAIEQHGKVRLPPRANPKHVPAPAAERRCPQCREIMGAERAADATIDVCPDCGGVWLDPGELSAARKRSALIRLERKVKSARAVRSDLNVAIDRVIEVVAAALASLEELPEVNPRGYVPKKPRGRKS